MAGNVRCSVVADLTQVAVSTKTNVSLNAAVACKFLYQLLGFQLQVGLGVSLVLAALFFHLLRRVFHLTV